METNNITESNRLIAEFMGLEKEERQGKSPLYKHSLKAGFVPASICVANLEYHTSWDWLIEVVNKLESNDFEVVINKRNCQIYNIEEQEFIGKDGDTKLEATYSAVIEFIKWYNQQSQ